ncbi:MAG: phosphate transport system regulatory protein PhoU [Methanosphaera sp.]|nr:phosphate transport system regulatory protein PhoU [Methanosphaera sp.]
MPEYRRRFRKKMNNLENCVEELCNLTVDNYEESSSIFNNYSDEKFEVVKENNELIYNKSHEVESVCVTLLAMEQPVASDLRFIENTLKIATHLRRISKLCLDIVNVATEINVESIPTEPLDTMNQMAQEVGNILKRGTRSFLTLNVEEAGELEKDDDTVDDLFDEFLLNTTKTMKDDPSTIDTLVPFILTGRYLERIADRSESIGDRVLLMDKYQLN